MITRPQLFGFGAVVMILASWMQSMWLGLVILIVIFVAEWRRPTPVPVRIRVKSSNRNASS